MKMGIVAAITCSRKGGRPGKLIAEQALWDSAWAPLQAVYRVGIIIDYNYMLA